VPKFLYLKERKQTQGDVKKRERKMLNYTLPNWPAVRKIVMTNPLLAIFY